MSNTEYWDSFDCQIQCEEIYKEDPLFIPENDPEDQNEYKAQTTSTTAIPVNHL